MEDQNLSKEQQERWDMWERGHKRGKVVTGVLVVAFGALYLAKELGAVFPSWLLSWKMAFIALGIAIAIKSNFKNWGWILFIGMGTLFLLSDVYPDWNLKHIVFPVVIIMMGMIIIFKPRRKWDPKRWSKWHHHRHGNNWQEWCDTDAVESGEDHIQSVSVFGSVKKNIISKKFKGGEIVNVFGGSEYNLSQVDLDGNASLEIVQFFGGTKLIIPSHWEIKSELTAVMGGIEDKRPIQTNVTNTDNKLLILRGTTIFGGIEIRS